MADKMMRIAGRTSGGVAVPMKASTDGDISTTRTWKKSWQTIVSGLEIRDTNNHNLDAIDVRDIPTFSLRIINRLGVPVTINFLTDVNTSNGYALNNMDQTSKSITVSPGNGYVIVTPEDLPFLNYVQYVRLQVKASTAPESGIFEAAMVTMR